MASIFAELPAMKTSLVLYDTRVVDMSDKLGQPVDVLMKVQLGGGNDTALALKYATNLIRQPARTIPWSRVNRTMMRSASPRSCRFTTTARSR